MNNFNIKDLLFYFNGRKLLLNKELKAKNFNSNLIKISVYNLNEENIKVIKKENNIYLDIDKLPKDCDILTCEKCFNIPKLTHINKNKIKIECRKCKTTKITNFSFFQKFLKIKKETLPNCTFLKQHSNDESINYCLKCCEYLCEECTKNHEISYKGKNHIMIQQKLYNKYYCNKNGHKEYILNHYCQKCNSYFCDKCKCYHSDEYIYDFEEEKNKEIIGNIITEMEKLKEEIKKEEIIFNDYLKELKKKEEDIERAFKDYKERNNNILFFYNVLINNYKRINFINNFNLNNNIIINNNFDFTSSQYFLKEKNGYYKTECFNSKYNRLYSFYMFKTYIQPLNNSSNIITNKLCGNNKIKKVIFLNEEKIIFIFDESKFIYYIYENKNDLTKDKIIMKKTISNFNFIKDIYALNDNQFISINNSEELCIWEIDENNIISPIKKLENVNLITFDLFNNENLFIFYKVNEEFNINYYTSTEEKLSLLFIDKNNYFPEYIYEDINNIIQTAEFNLIKKDENILKFNKDNMENINYLYEYEQKLCGVIDKKFILAFNGYKNKFFNKYENKYYINTNYIVNEFKKEIKYTGNIFQNHEKDKIQYLINFYELCFQIRKLYIINFISSNKINNIYNLNNEFLIFTGDKFLFIIYSIKKREFFPVITNNYINNIEKEYNNYEIKKIYEDNIILNDLNKKIIYIIDSNKFLLYQKNFKYHNNFIVNDKYLLFDIIQNNEIQFSFIDITDFFSKNNDYKKFTELFTFKIYNYFPKILSFNNGKLIYLYEDNQLCIVNYNLSSSENIQKNYTKKGTKKIELIEINKELIIPETCTSSSIYKNKYDVSKLFSNDSYFCSNTGSNENIYFNFDKEYFFKYIELINYEDYLNCRPKNFYIYIYDEKKRKRKEYEIYNKSTGTQSIKINEKGKYIEFNFIDNYNGKYIIIKKINFHVKVINNVK